MAIDKTISELSRLEGCDGGELLPVAKNGDNGAVTTAVLREYMQQGLVPEEPGKGLSTNDYTDEDRTKLDSLPDAAEIEAGKRALFADLWRAWDGTVSADAEQFGKFGVEMDYDKAVRVYGMRELIDRVTVAGVTFNAQTELFACNGVGDLTRDDMELIDREWLLHQGGAPTSKIVQSRTNYALSPTSGSQGFYNFQAQNMEVLSLPSLSYPIAFTGWLSASHPKLRRILGTIDLTYFTNPSNMSNGLNCPNLTDVSFSRVKVDFNISKLASISLESLTYLVSNSANGSTAITVTVHADVYAKLTDEADAEWFALLGAAAARNISFATTSGS